jgi:hypothetical protein
VRALKQTELGSLVLGQQVLQVQLLAELRQQLEYQRWNSATDLGNHADYEALLFDLVGLHGIGIS